MIWKLLQLAFPIVFIGIAFYFYQTKRALLIGFREQLSHNTKGRRFVELCALLTLLLYHFIALCGTSRPLHLLPSSIGVFALFSHRCGEIMMHSLQHKRCGYCAFLLALAALMRPETTPIGVTMLVLLVASWVYPTKKQEHKKCESDHTTVIIEDTIDELHNEMKDIHSPIISEDVYINDVIEDAEYEELPPTGTEHKDANKETIPSSTLSDKAIRNQMMRERERERRHKRAKRRARRAKNGR